MSEALPPALEDASPSTRHVWRTIAMAERPLRPGEIETRTGYSLGTIRVATSELEDADLVESVYPDHDDLRKRAFRPR